MEPEVLGFVFLDHHADDALDFLADARWKGDGGAGRAADVGAAGDAIAGAVDAAGGVGALGRGRPFVRALQHASPVELQAVSQALALDPDDARAVGVVHAAHAD